MRKISRLDKLKNLDVHGTQAKWKIGNIWYKADDFNHEGLAETIVSDMLQKSNVKKFAVYEPELIQYNDNVVTGCKSEHFLLPGEKLIEATSLFDLYGRGDVIKDDSDAMKDPQKAITEFLVTMEDITKLTDFDRYLTMMFELDKIVLNPDRHFANISVLKTAAGFDYAPFFDQGRSFALCDDLWNTGKSIEEIIDSVESRPFSGIFSRQTDILEDIVHEKVLEIGYSQEDLDVMLSKCANIYPDNILKRAEDIFKIQFERNIGYFYGKDIDARLDDILEQINKKIQYPLQFQCNKDCQYIMIEPENRNGVGFRVSADRKIQALKNGNVISDDDLIFKYNESLQGYKDLYHALNDEDTIEKEQSR